MSQNETVLHINCIEAKQSYQRGRTSTIEVVKRCWKQKRLKRTMKTKNHFENEIAYFRALSIRMKHVVNKALLKKGRQFEFTINE